MSDPHNSSSRRDAVPISSTPGRAAQDKPAWAEGIRALYDAVTQEPLPSDFQRLLDELAKLPRK